MSATASPLTIDPAWGEAFARAGLVTGPDVLARAVLVRDLPDRQNLVCEIGGTRVWIKRTKRGGGESPEARATRRVAALGVPAARLVFDGPDGRGGALVGHADLAPARPLDDVLAEGGLGEDARRRLARSLARAVATLHAARLHHRDLYLNHVWVDPAREDPLVALIDWERLGRHRRAFGRRVVKDLAALDASAPEGAVGEGLRRRFLLRYLRHRGAPSHFAVLARRIRRKAGRIRRHVPRTPVGEAARPGSAT